MKKTKKYVRNSFKRISVIILATLILVVQGLFPGGYVKAQAAENGYSDSTTITGICGTNCVYAFDPSSGMLVIEGNNGKIDDRAFEGRTDIKSVYIGTGVSQIGQRAFYQCSNLMIVSMESGVEKIDKLAFSDCKSLISFSMPNTVRLIGECAFSFCTSLSFFVIPESVQLIYSNTFLGSSKMILIICSDWRPTIQGKDLGKGMTVKAIYAPQNNTSIRTYARNNDIPCYTAAFAGTECLEVGETVTRDISSASNYSGLSVNPLVATVDTNYSKITMTGVSSGHTDILFMHYSGSAIICMHVIVGEAVVPDSMCLYVGEEVDISSICALGYSVFSNNTDYVEAYVDFIVGAKAGKTSLTAAKPGREDKQIPVTIEFKDVRDSNAYFYTPVYWAVEKNITAGVKNTETGYFDTFSPSSECTRAQMISFLWRMAGAPNPKSGVNIFSDVSPSDYYYKAVQWGVQNGIVGGYSDGTFRPNGKCTRAQAVSFLWRYYGKPEPTASASSFVDNQNTETYYYKAVLWASEKGITGGYSDGSFKPSGNCTRAQMVTFLYRCRNIKKK